MRIRTLLFTTLIVFSLIVVSTVWQYSLEQHARSSARQILQKVSSCINEYPEGTTYDKIEFCAQGVRTTPTGDMFAFDLQSRKFLYDPSVDCKIEGGSHMTEDSICAIHADPLKCKTTLVQMVQGVNSYPSLRAQWQFDDAIEYLEWVILPDVNHNMDGSIVNNQEDGHRILLAIGIQSDELYAEFTLFDLFLKGLAFVFIVVNLIVGVFTRKKDGNLAGNT